MDQYARAISLDIPHGQAAFLWGARQTGKTTYLRSQFDESKYYDLLNFDTRFRLLTRPSSLGEELALLSNEQKEKPIVIDEIQKVPELLDEVHRLLEQRQMSFVLCGSSARKLRQAGINLLGGRAWRYQMLPLSWREVPDFNLTKALTQGLLPRIYNSSHPKRSLTAYVEDYLAQEIVSEALTRNTTAFVRFFDSLKYCHAEMLNYTSIARDCGVSTKTVQSYFSILQDTLVGYLIYPFHRSGGRQTIVSAPKFYLFDLGVAQYLRGSSLTELSGTDFGPAFEHFIFLELIAARSFSEDNWSIEYWRTKSGLEVDFVLADRQVAIEVKAKVRSRDIRPIRSFSQEFSPRRSIVVTADTVSRKVGDIEVLNYQDFLDQLHTGHLL